SGGRVRSALAVAVSRGADTNAFRNRRMNRRMLLRVVVVAIGVIALALHWLKPKEAAVATSTSGERLVEARDTRGFTLGTLAFAPCELGQRNSTETTAAYCAPFQVPENWDKPDGRKIDLKLAIVRSDAQVAERDLVVFLAGGPGQAATETYPRVQSGFGPLL